MLRIYNELAVNRSDSINEKKEIKQAPNYFKKLSDDILKNSLFELTEIKTTAVAFAETSTRHHQLFQSQIDVSHFMRLVAYGEQDQAETILKKIKDKKALNLMLTKKIDVTDIAKKKFKNITAFQYALWALDWHMWTMLLKYLPKDKAKSQLEELEEKGVTYTRPEFGDQKEEHVTNEQHFDFSPLINSLQNFVDNRAVRTTDEKREYWCKYVGGAQINIPVNIPAHVASEYCRPFYSFSTSRATFTESELNRTLMFNNKESLHVDSKTGEVGCKENWYTSKIGSELAVVGGPGLRWGDLDGGISRPFSPRPMREFEDWSDPLLDIQAICKLRDIRMEQYAAFKSTLYSTYQNNGR